MVEMAGSLESCKTAVADASRVDWSKGYDVLLFFGHHEKEIVPKPCYIVRLY